VLRTLTEIEELKFYMDFSIEVECYTKLKTLSLVFFDTIPESFYHLGDTFPCLQSLTLTIRP